MLYILRVWQQRVEGMAGRTSANGIRGYVGCSRDFRIAPKATVAAISESRQRRLYFRSDFRIAPAIFLPGGKDDE